MNYQVSILVPIYNVSSYIERCAVTLFDQTFDNIEYIFVNDASEDNSIEKLIEVADRFPKRREHIKIIHHPKNLGLAAARNTALDASTGDYIAVVDSDDYIDLEMIETLYAAAVKEDADIVVSDILIEMPGNITRYNDSISDSNQDHFLNIIGLQSSPSLCNKLIKRTLYSRPDCRVPEGLNYWEDRYVTIRLFYFAKKTIKIDQAFYHYVKENRNSITKKKDRMHFENVIQFWNQLDLFLSAHNIIKQNLQTITFMKVKSKAQLMIETNNYSLRKEFASLFQEEEAQFNPTLRKGERIMIKLIRHRLFFIAQCFRLLLVIKNKHYEPYNRKSI